MTTIELVLLGVGQGSLSKDHFKPIFTLVGVEVVLRLALGLCQYLKYEKEPFLFEDSICIT